MPQHVRVVPPDPAWAEGYRRERALLMPVFGPLLVELVGPMVPALAEIPPARRSGRPMGR